MRMLQRIVNLGREKCKWRDNEKVITATFCKAQEPCHPTFASPLRQDRFSRQPIFLQKMYHLPRSYRAAATPTRNPKSQFTNHKQIPNSKHQLLQSTDNGGAFGACL